MYVNDFIQICFTSINNTNNETNTKIAVFFIKTRLALISTQKFYYKSIVPLGSITFEFYNHRLERIWHRTKSHANTHVYFCASIEWYTQSHMLNGYIQVYVNDFIQMFFTSIDNTNNETNTKTAILFNETRLALISSQQIVL